MILALEHSSSLILCHFGLTVLIGRIGLQQLSARLGLSDGNGTCQQSHIEPQKLLRYFRCCRLRFRYHHSGGIDTSTGGIGSGAKFDVTTVKVVAPPPEPLGHPDIEDLPTCLVKVENQYIMVKI